MSLHSDTLSWFQANQSLLLLLNAARLAEKQQLWISVFGSARLGLQVINYPPRGKYANNYKSVAPLSLKALSLWKQFTSWKIRLLVPRELASRATNYMRSPRWLHTRICKIKRTWYRMYLYRYRYITQTMWFRFLWMNYKNKSDFLVLFSVINVSNRPNCFCSKYSLEDPNVTEKCRTAIKAILLYFNLRLSVVLNILSWSISY